MSQATRALVTFLVAASLTGLGGLAGCGGDPIPAERPRTARATSGERPARAGKPAKRGQGEAARRAQEEHAASGEQDLKAGGKKWGGWKYQGPADDCFYVVKRRCFVELDDACAAARCGKRECVTRGAGPASVVCE